jgi:poly(3-hydroxybutyrate) depolymerase
LRTSIAHRLVALLIALVVATSLQISAPVASAAVRRPQMVSTQLAGPSVPAHILYLPSNAAARGPLKVLVALHGMGSNGTEVSAPLQAYAEHYGWVLVAPTFNYGDWTDPEQVRRDDTTFLPQLKNLLDSLPARTGLPLQPRVLIYGFSRGAQSAHRFAEFYPRSVQAVAAFSCGTYTLPFTTSPANASQPLAFPYGVADLQRYTGRPFDLESFQQVSFLVGIGARDNQPGDLPRQWDPYIGASRLDRAMSYARALQSLGMRVDVSVFDNTTHAETPDTRGRAMDFLATS